MPKVTARPWYIRGYLEIKSRLNIPAEWGVLLTWCIVGGTLVVDELAARHFIVVLSFYSIVY